MPSPATCTLSKLIHPPLKIDENMSTYPVDVLEYIRHHTTRHDNKGTMPGAASTASKAKAAAPSACPRIGVCLPSFGGLAGARRVRMMSAQRERIVSALYTASSGLCNLLLDSRYFRLSADACGCVFLEVVYLTAPMPCRMPAMPVAATSLTIIPSSSNE